MVCLFELYMRGRRLNHKANIYTFRIRYMSECISTYGSVCTCECGGSSHVKSTKEHNGQYKMHNLMTGTKMPIKGRNLLEGWQGNSARNSYRGMLFKLHSLMLLLYSQNRPSAHSSGHARVYTQEWMLSTHILWRCNTHTHTHILYRDGFDVCDWLHLFHIAQPHFRDPQGAA